MKLSTILAASLFGIILGTSFAVVNDSSSKGTRMHSQDRTESVRPTSPPTSIEVAGSIARSEGIITLPTIAIVGQRPTMNVVAVTRKTPCKAQDEGTRDLVQGSGTVRTYTFCAR